MEANFFTNIFEFVSTKNIDVVIFFSLFYLQTSAQ